jgi:hypothetical protein
VNVSHEDLKSFLQGPKSKSPVGETQPGVTGEISESSAAVALFQPPEYVRRYPVAEISSPESKPTIGMLSVKVVVLHFTRGPSNETVKVQLAPHGDEEVVVSLDIKAPLAVARTGCFVVLVMRPVRDKTKNDAVRCKTYPYNHWECSASIYSFALTKVPLPVKLLLKVGTLCSVSDLNVLATTVNDPGGKIIAAVISQPSAVTILRIDTMRSVLGCSNARKSV